MSSKCYAPERLSKFVQSPEYEDRVMGVLKDSCSRMFQSYTNFSTLPIKDTQPCDEKVESMRPMMKLLGDLARPCVAYREVEEVPVQERKNILAPPNTVKMDMIMNPPLDLVPSSPLPSTDCRQYCTNTALSQCTYYCSFAIYFCGLEPYTPTCLDYAFECFWNVPVCCDCAAYYGLCSCSVCGY